MGGLIRGRCGCSGGSAKGGSEAGRGGSWLGFRVSVGQGHVVCCVGRLMGGRWSIERRGGVSVGGKVVGSSRIEEREGWVGACCAARMS